LIEENKFCHSVIDVIFASRYLFIFYVYLSLSTLEEKKAKEKIEKEKILLQDKNRFITILLFFFFL